MRWNYNCALVTRMDNRLLWFQSTGDFLLLTDFLSENICQRTPYVTYIASYRIALTSFTIWNNFRKLIKMLNSTDFLSCCHILLASLSQWFFSLSPTPNNKLTNYIEYICWGKTWHTERLIEINLLYVCICYLERMDTMWLIWFSIQIKYLHKIHIWTTRFGYIV